MVEFNDCFDMILKNSYYRGDDIIDFYFLNRECSGSCLEPYLLGISKNKRKK